MINTAAKKYFSTVVLLYDGIIFIDILKNQPPNVNSYRKVLQTCSKAVRPCREKKRKFKRNQRCSSSLLSMKGHENSSPFEFSEVPGL